MKMPRLKYLGVVVSAIGLCALLFLLKPAKVRGETHDHDDPQASNMAMEHMSMDHMPMNPHMDMTKLRKENRADDKKADEIVDTLRKSIAKYEDYKVALDDGYHIFMPKLPQPRYHFTSTTYAIKAAFTFDPEHPTSLLYTKEGSGYKLIGAMYTAPKNFTEDQLNERVPLSVAVWHRHVNFCMPKDPKDWHDVDWKKFGLAGSISTEAACNEAGGRWIPQVFGWMVHVYPFEKDPEKIWAH